jgi:hypothetical protein
MRQGRKDNKRKDRERGRNRERQEEWGKKNPKCEIMTDEQDKKCNGGFIASLGRHCLN